MLTSVPNTAAVEPAPSFEIQARQVNHLGYSSPTSQTAESDDFTKLEVQSPETEIDIEGVPHRMVVSGFGDCLNGENVKNEWYTPESTATTSCLWGSLSQVRPLTVKAVAEAPVGREIPEHFTVTSQTGLDGDLNWAGRPLELAPDDEGSSASVLAPGQKVSFSQQTPHCWDAPSMTCDGTNVVKDPEYTQNYLWAITNIPEPDLDEVLNVRSVAEISWSLGETDYSATSDEAGVVLDHSDGLNRFEFTLAHEVGEDECRFVDTPARIKETLSSLLLTTVAYEPEPTPDPTVELTVKPTPTLAVKPTPTKSTKLVTRPTTVVTKLVPSSGSEKQQQLILLKEKVESPQHSKEPSKEPADEPSVEPTSEITEEVEVHQPVGGSPAPTVTPDSVLGPAPSSNTTVPPLSALLGGLAATAVGAGFIGRGLTWR